MSYSTTAFVHIIVIYATHGWNPPILDLDVLGIFLLGAVGVSMYPALAASQRSRYMSPGVEEVVGYWWFIMFLISSLATLLLNNLKDLRQNSNSEVACYLPDNTLLTSLAQLNGTRDLECIYDCFFTRKSVMKTQDAVTVAAVFAIIGGGIYRVLQDPKNGEEGLEPAVNSPTDYMMSGALSEPGGNIPTDDLLAPDRGEDAAASNQSAHLLDEIDLGTYIITPESER